MDFCDFTGCRCPVHAFIQIVGTARTESAWLCYDHALAISSKARSVRGRQNVHHLALAS